MPVLSTAPAITQVSHQGTKHLKHSALLAVLGGLLFGVAVVFSTHSFSIFLAIFALGAFAESIHYLNKGVWYKAFPKRVFAKQQCKRD